MAKQRDVTTLTPLAEFSDTGYVLVVQNNDIYALPKTIWTNEIYKQYKANLDTWKADFDTWYESVKGTFENNDSQASDIATLKNQIKKCVMEDEGSVVMNSTNYLLPANAVKLDSGNTVEATVSSLESSVDDIDKAIAGLGTYTELGTYNESGVETPVSVASGVSKTIQTITFTTAGTYMIDTDVNFAANADGIRVCKFSPDKDDTSMTRSAVTAMPVSGVGTAMTFQTIVKVNAGKTCYINVRHTAGVDLNVNARCRIVKLANA